MKVEIKKKMPDRSIFIEAEICTEKLKSTIMEINEAIAVFESKNKNSDKEAQ